MNPVVRAEREAEHAANLKAFCEQHNVIATRGVVDLWGFGEASACFEPADGAGWWIPAGELIAPAGMTSSSMSEAFTEDYLEYGETRVGFLPVRSEEGELDQLPLVNHQFALWIFSSRSPWAREFAQNTIGLLRGAFHKSGLAEHLGLADIINEPDQVEARQKAFAGPSAALIDRSTS